MTLAAAFDAPSAAPPARSLEDRVKAAAYGLGFDLVGFATLGPVETAPAFDAWIARGYAGEMDYLPRGAEKRRDSRLPYDGVCSAIVVALDYGGREPSGPIARYARGDDYHDVMSASLEELHRTVGELAGRAVRGKAYVDTGPILERDLARRAGLGWFGKNTNLVNPAIGSFFFLGTLLVDYPFAPDEPFEADRCGTCTRCLDACPTQAFTGERVLDATRCISYLTIEHRGAVPEALREPMGELLYGCDICQDVCPWNVRFARELRVPEFRPRTVLAPNDARTIARAMLSMTQEEFSAAFRNSPVKRAKRRGVARNAAVVLGNLGDARDLPVLTAALEDDEPLVREHAAAAIVTLSRRLESTGAHDRGPVVVAADRR